MIQSTKTSSVYRECVAALTTKHEKSRAIATPMRAGLGLKLLTVDFDTDTLGTFTGEVERKGSALQNALRKARIGMARSGMKLGIASEGSFGPHPQVPLVCAGEEVLVFIDDKLNIEVVEQIVSLKTNFANCSVQNFEDLSDFLTRMKFPSHAVIVRPSRWRTSLVSRITSKLGMRNQENQIFKGVSNLGELKQVFDHCKSFSEDGCVLVETDMRAHVNPTRLRVIRQLAIKLARRLSNHCRSCGCPGWGVTDVVRGLPCADCGLPSDLPKSEIFSCPGCSNRETSPRAGAVVADPMYCNRCNP